MLVVHRIDDVDEGLIRVEDPVASGEQIAFEPALECVLAEHLHHATVRRDVRTVGIFWYDRRQPGFQARLVDVLQPVRGILVWTEETKVVMF